MEQITKCRACGSTALTPAFTLDDMAHFENGKRVEGPVDFVLCDGADDAHACGLLQASNERSSLFRRVSASSAYRSNRSHLRSVATEALETISGRDCTALDIGCNDGTLLSFYPRWVERFGIDSSEIVESVGAWATTMRTNFPSPEFEKAYGDKKFDLITAVSILEQISDPQAFFQRLKSSLTQDGVLVIETLYAPMALARAGFDAFVSGAEAVYSLSVLERLARDNGLKIFRGALTDKEGGSIRLFLTHAGQDAYDFDPWYERLARLWDEENALALRALQPYQAFENRAVAARASFQHLLSSLKDAGETAHLLSDGAHAIALYNWAQDDGAVITAAISQRPTASSPYLCDDGPIVLSEAEGRAAEADYLIAPAPYKREFLERWREAIMLGARIIVATPEPHIVDASNYAAEFGKALSGGDSSGEVETLHAILSAAGRPRLIAARQDTSRAS